MVSSSQISDIHNYIHKIIIRNLALISQHMHNRTIRSQYPNQQSIAEQITTLDLGQRKQLTKNSSQKYVHSSFEIIEEQEPIVSRKASIKSVWFECGSHQMNQTFKDGSMSYVSSFEPRGSSQKKAIKIYSIANVKRQSSSKKNEVRSQKINVSLNKKTQKKTASDVWSTYFEKRTPQKIQKQNIILFQQHKIKVDLKLPVKQEIVAKKMSQIKQPDFHSKHPLQGNQRYLNGAYLSKIITEKALQTKSKPFILLQGNNS